MEIYFPCVKIPYRFVTPLAMTVKSTLVSTVFSENDDNGIIRFFLPLFADMIGHELQDIDLFPIS